MRLIFDVDWSTDPTVSNIRISKVVKMTNLSIYIIYYIITYIYQYI